MNERFFIIDFFQNNLQRQTRQSRGFGTVGFKNRFKQKIYSIKKLLLGGTGVIKKQIKFLFF